MRQKRKPSGSPPPSVVAAKEFRAETQCDAVDGQGKFPPPAQPDSATPSSPGGSRWLSWLLVVAALCGIPSLFMSVMDWMSKRGSVPTVDLYLGPYVLRPGVLTRLVLAGPTTRPGEVTIAGLPLVARNLSEKTAPRVQITTAFPSSVRAKLDTNASVTEVGPLAGLRNSRHSAITQENLSLHTYERDQLDPGSGFVMLDSVVIAASTRRDDIDLPESAFGGVEYISGYRAKVTLSGQDMTPRDYPMEIIIAKAGDPELIPLCGLDRSVRQLKLWSSTTPWWRALVTKREIILIVAHVEPKLECKTDGGNLYSASYDRAYFWQADIAHGPLLWEIAPLILVCAIAVVSACWLWRYMTSRARERNDASSKCRTE